MTSQRIGKYACLEVECRFLLDRVPEGLPGEAGGWLITDRYFPGTRLRLREMRSMAGEERICKLTQKYRAAGQGAYEATVTNEYLSEGEFELLARLEGRELRKRRYPFAAEGRRFSIDVFEGRHAGLVLAELELETPEEAGALGVPSFALRDVTGEAFFSGGRLAMMGEEEFREGWRKVVSG